MHVITSVKQSLVTAVGVLKRAYPGAIARRFHTLILGEDSTGEGLKRLVY